MKKYIFLRVAALTLAITAAWVVSGFAQQAPESATKIALQEERLCLPQYVEYFQQIRRQPMQTWATPQETQKKVKELFHDVPSFCEADAYEEFMESFTEYAKEAFDGTKNQLWVVQALLQQRPSQIKKDKYVDLVSIDNTAKQALDSIQEDRCHPSGTKTRRKSSANCSLINQIMLSVKAMPSLQELEPMYPELEKMGTEVVVPTVPMPKWALAALGKITSTIPSDPGVPISRSGLSKIKFWLNGIWGWILHPTKDAAIPSNWDVSQAVIVSAQTQGRDDMESLVQAIAKLKGSLPLKTLADRTQAIASLKAMGDLVSKLQ